MFGVITEIKEKTLLQEDIEAKRVIENVLKEIPKLKTGYTLVCKIVTTKKYSDDTTSEISLFCEIELDKVKKDGIKYHIITNGRHHQKYDGQGIESLTYDLDRLPFQIKIFHDYNNDYDNYKFLRVTEEYIGFRKIISPNYRQNRNLI